MKDRRLVVPVDDSLDECIKSDALRLGASKATVVRMILLKHYRRQMKANGDHGKGEQ